MEGEAGKLEWVHHLHKLWFHPQQLQDIEKHRQIATFGSIIITQDR